jgi:hypothetical protein
MYIYPDTDLGIFDGREKHDSDHNDINGDGGNRGYYWLAIYGSPFNSFQDRGPSGLKRDRKCGIGIGNRTLL